MTKQTDAKKKTIAYLNHALKNELTAINQYFLHYRMFKHMGYGKLAEKEHHESIDEMKHADKLIERVLFLGGTPNVQDVGKVYIGENVQEMLECDLKVEHLAVPLLKEAIAFMEGQEDFVSADLLHAILASEEEHIDWIETQLRLIMQLGIEGYLITQV